MDGQRRGGGSHFICQHITCHISVHCNTMQPSSIVQFSTEVGWFTKKYKGVILNKIYRAEILQETLEVQELHRKRSVTFVVIWTNLWRF